MKPNPQPLLMFALALLFFVPARAGAQPPEARNLTLGAPDTAFAVVHLRDDGGQCTVLHKTDTVRASRSKKMFVEFVVVNDCATAVQVSVTDFAHRTMPAAADPFDTQAIYRRRNAPANQVSNALRLHIRSTAELGTWTYNLRINDAIVDPKIEIDQ